MFDDCLKTKELFVQRVFVFFLGSFHLFANFIFREVSPFPFIYFSYRMINRREGLFLSDGGYPFLNCRLVGGLHLILSSGTSNGIFHLHGWH